MRGRRGGCSDAHGYSYGDVLADHFAYESAYCNTGWPHSEPYSLAYGITDLDIDCHVHTHDRTNILSHSGAYPGPSGEYVD